MSSALTIGTLLLTALIGLSATHHNVVMPYEKPPVKNPIVEHGADPWMIHWKGQYYFMATRGDRVAVRKVAKVSDMHDAPEVTIWHGNMPSPFEHFTRDVWAPEIHRINGKWYVYFTATDGPDEHRRVFVLESKTDDALGEYRFKGKLEPQGQDFYAIDATVYQRSKDGALFALWSGRDPELWAEQRIFIAPMSNPWTISGPRVCLSRPLLDWERHGWLVNEGPAVLEHNGKVSVVYSGSGGTTPNYALGLLTNTTGDLLDPKAWVKSQKPVFEQYTGPDGRVFTPGHNGFFKSPDGKEDWIIYHGKENQDGTWGGRSARIQKFTWSDGKPIFGHPLPASIPVPAPSGE